MSMCFLCLIDVGSADTTFFFSFLCQLCDCAQFVAAFTQFVAAFRFDERADRCAKHAADGAPADE